MGIVVRKGGLRDSPYRECREKSILLDATRVEPQAQVCLRRGRADQDGSASSIPPRRASVSPTLVRDTCVSFDERSRDLATLGVEKIKRLGVEGRIFSGQLAASVVGEGGGMDGRWRRRGW